MLGKLILIWKVVDPLAVVEAVAAWLVVVHLDRFQMDLGLVLMVEVPVIQLVELMEVTLENRAIRLVAVHSLQQGKGDCLIPLLVAVLAV